MLNAPRVTVLRRSPVVCPLPSHPCPFPYSQWPFSHFSCRYVYDHIGGAHSAVIPELAATVATFAITTLWLGPCDIVYLWSFLNCFGLNFELWVQKLAEWGPLARIEVSREDLGLELSGLWRAGGHFCFLELSNHLAPKPELSHHHPPGCQGNGSLCGNLPIPPFYGEWSTWALPCWSGLALSLELFPHV